MKMTKNKKNVFHSEGTKKPQRAMSECPGKEVFRPVPRATSRARASLCIGAERSDSSRTDAQGAGAAETTGAPFVPPAFLSGKGGAPTRGGTVLFHLRRGAPYQKLFVPQGSETTVQARDVRLALRQRLCALKPQFAEQIALIDEVTGTSLLSSPSIFLLFHTNTHTCK